MNKPNCKFCGDRKIIATQVSWRTPCPYCQIDMSKRAMSALREQLDEVTAERDDLRAGPGAPCGACGLDPQYEAVTQDGCVGCDLDDLREENAKLKRKLKKTKRKQREADNAGEIYTQELFNRLAKLQAAVMDFCDGAYGFQHSLVTEMFMACGVEEFDKLKATLRASWQPELQTWESEKHNAEN